MSEDKKHFDHQSSAEGTENPENVKKVDFDTALLDDTSIFAATNEIAEKKERAAAENAKVEEKAEPPAAAKTKKQTEIKRQPKASKASEDEGKMAELDAELLQEDEKKDMNWGKELRDWVVAIGIAVVLALVIRNYVFTLVKVQGQSMEPTLHNADRLYVNRFFYTPKKGDVIIFVPETDPHRPYVKRVIATAGDSVYIDFKTGNVFVNGQLLEEPYIKEKTRNNGSYIMSLMQQGSYGPDAPIVIQEGHIFVMGDNRNNSKDSRELGQVPLDEVLGGAVFRFWPLDHLGSVHRDAISTSFADDDGVYGLGSSDWNIEG